MNNMAIIDWVQFNENFQYYDQEIITEVIGDFFNEADERLDTLRKNIEDKDFDNLTFNAHSLKSVVGVFMAPKPHELAARIEMMGKEKSCEGIDEVFSELKASIEGLILELQDFLKK